MNFIFLILKIFILLIHFLLDNFIYFPFKYYPLSWFPLWNHHSIPPLPDFRRVLPHPPNYSCLPVLAKEQGPLLALISYKTILCYLCSWSLGSLHVCSLVGGWFNSWEQWVYVCVGVSGWLILLFFLWVVKPFSSFSPFSNSSIGVPVLSPMVGSEH